MRILDLNEFYKKFESAKDGLWKSKEDNRLYFVEFGCNKAIIGDVYEKEE